MYFRVDYFSANLRAVKSSTNLLSFVKPQTLLYHSLFNDQSFRLSVGPEVYGLVIIYGLNN